MPNNRKEFLLQESALSVWHASGSGSYTQLDVYKRQYVGIVRSDLRLKRAWDRLDIIYEETESLFKRSVASREICELRNMVNVGYLIMRQAMERKESRGLHYTIDYPHVKK